MSMVTNLQDSHHIENMEKKLRHHMQLLYSGSPSFVHPVNMATSLLQPHYSDPNKSSFSHFLI